MSALRRQHADTLAAISQLEAKEQDRRNQAIADVENIPAVRRAGAASSRLDALEEGVKSLETHVRGAIETSLRERQGDLEVHDRRVKRLEAWRDGGDRVLGAEATLTWTAVEGRRPQVHHDAPLDLDPDQRGLIQASGRVAAVVHHAPNEANIDDLVVMALEHDVARLTLRCTLPADLQPKLQGSLDRQLSRRHGRRQAFLCHAGQGPEVHLLCVGPTVQEGTR